MDRYDRRIELTPIEQETLSFFVSHTLNSFGTWHRRIHIGVARLLAPINDVFNRMPDRYRGEASRLWGAKRVVLLEVHGRQESYWSWGDESWSEILCGSATAFARKYNVCLSSRSYVLMLAFYLGGFQRVERIGDFRKVRTAEKIFGKNLVAKALDQVHEALTRLGYRATTSAPKKPALPSALCQMLLLNGSPYIEDITVGVLRQAQSEWLPASLRPHVVKISKALEILGVTRESVPRRAGMKEHLLALAPPFPLSDEWCAWIRRWNDTSTLAKITRRGVVTALTRVGRWLSVTHPDVRSPEHWTRELALEYAAVLPRVKIGEYSFPNDRRLYGKPRKAATIANDYANLRIYFRDLQGWDWITRKFNPATALNTPKSIRTLIGPDPRNLPDDVWAKLLWAGLNLTTEDLTVFGSKALRGKAIYWYSTAMVRAVAAVWLFCGLRANEIRRLRVGCIKRQQDTAPVPGETPPRDPVCFLEVPVNKTGTAFTKPVDRVVGEAVELWEKVRPEQQSWLDEKTGEMVHLLFMNRGKPLGQDYLNGRLIPALCRKAGVDVKDARGRITSHRARSTIATQLFNAKEPMSLFELQAWLGHRSPETTQHYTRVTPTKLAKSFADADYFKRNLRLVQVLVDQEAIKSGAATKEPWKYYDLGHGYCTYDFFDQCPHRMACAKCSFYLPKVSTKALFLEGRANLQRMMQEIPLTDEEKSAVKDGIDALNKLTGC